MKKIFLIVALVLVGISVYAADQVILIDKTGKEVDPGASNRWPVIHTNATVAGVKMLLSAPGNTKSHYVTGFIMSGGADADGFYFLRQNCVLLNAAADNIALTEDGTTFDWDTKTNNGDFSLELWINYEATTAAAPALVKTGDETNNGWLLEASAASLLTFTFDDGTNTATFTGATAIDVGEWHHVVVSVERSSSTGLNHYVDGELDATAVDPTGVANAVNAAANIIVTGVNSEEIYISALGLYLDADAFLSATEVVTRYNSGIGLKYEGDETGLIVGYNIDEGSGTSCYDIKNATGNIIALTGTPWAPSRQNGATAEVNVDGIPINEQDMTVAVGKFHCGVGSAFGGFPVIFPHPIKIGRNCPLSILETNGAFSLIVFGFTDIVR